MFRFRVTLEKPCLRLQLPVEIKKGCFEAWRRKCGRGKRMRDIFRGEGARLSRHFDFTRIKINTGRHRSETYSRTIHRCCLSNVDTIENVDRLQSA